MHTYRGGERRILTVTLVALDGSMVAAAFGLAYLMRLSGRVLPYNVLIKPETYGGVIALALLLWWLVFAGLGLYDPARVLGGPGEYGQVVKGSTYGMFLLIMVSFFWRETIELSRLWVLMGWGFSIALVGGGRFTLRRVIYWLRRRSDWFITRVIIAGANEQGQAMARQWGLSSGVEVVGFVDDFMPVGTRVTGDLAVLGHPRHLPYLARREGVREVVVVPNAIAWETFEEIIQESTQLDGFAVTLSPGFYEIMMTGVQVLQREFVPLLKIQDARIAGIDALLKMTLDYVGGGLALIPGMPVMLFIAVLLKVTAPSRPVFDRPVVNGQGGKRFTTIKFDVAVTEGMGGAAAKWRRGLYSAGLDKSPQLVSVMAGQMSLVGPRTTSRREATAYHRRLPNLLAVKPGLTGPWAISGRKAALEDEVRANMYYIRNWTIWLDLQILFRTGWRVLRQERSRAKLAGLEGIGLDGLPVLSET